MELLDTTIQSHSSSTSSDEINGEMMSHDEDDQDEIIDVQYWDKTKDNVTVNFN